MTPGTNYYYEVVATESSGSSQPSQSAGVTTDVPTVTAVPAAPSGLTATSDSTGTLAALSWTDNSGGTASFQVAISENGASFTPIGTAPTGVTSYIATGLTPGDSYYFEVTAINAGGSSTPSTLAPVSMALPSPEPRAPAAPVITSATSDDTGSQVTLNWTESSDFATGYEVAISTDGLNYTQIGTTTAGVTTFRAVGLNSGATYSFEVTAIDPDADSLPSAPVSLTTTLPATPPPPAPTIVKAVSDSTGTQVVVNWTDNSDGDASFLIDESTDGVNFTQIGTAPNGTGTFTATGLTPGTIYYFEVTATDSSGTSSPSSAAKVTTAVPAPQLPAAPSGLTASSDSTGTQATLKWTDNSQGAASFAISESTDGVNYSPIGTTAAGVTSYTATGLTPGSSYDFEVTATDTAGKSSPSNVATLTTAVPAPQLPSAPSGLTASSDSTGTQATLKWTDNSQGAASFAISESTDGVNYSPIGTTAAGVTSYTATGLTPGVVVRF